MGRRKKEIPEVHRENMAFAAEQLFTTKGVEATTVEDIAKASGYSKATLYVYFKNKEEIVGLLVLKSMKMLLERMEAKVSEKKSTKEQYNAICKELVQYQQEFPFYFELALREINIDLESPDTLEVERETFVVGEQINAAIAKFMQEGIDNGSLRQDISIPQTVFIFWASLSGMILLAANKEAYIERILGIEKQTFLEDGFEMLFKSIGGEGN